MRPLLYNDSAIFMASYDEILSFQEANFMNSIVFNGSGLGQNFSVVMFDLQIAFDSEIYLMRVSI